MNKTPKSPTPPKSIKDGGSNIPPQKTVPPIPKTGPQKKVENNTLD